MLQLHSRTSGSIQERYNESCHSRRHQPRRTRIFLSSPYQHWRSESPVCEWDQNHFWRTWEWERDFLSKYDQAALELSNPLPFQVSRSGAAPEPCTATAIERCRPPHKCDRMIDTVVYVCRDWILIVLVGRMLLNGLLSQHNLSGINPKQPAAYEQLKSSALVRTGLGVIDHRERYSNLQWCE